MQAQGTKKALIIVDMQNDFCQPNGSLAVGESLDIIPVINQLRESDKFDFVVMTRDWHPQDHVSFGSNHPGKDLFSNIVVPETGREQVMWPDHCVQNTFGSEFQKDVAVKDSDIQVLKGQAKMVESYSGFGNDFEDTGLANLLKEKDVGIVYSCGLAYDYCVGSTAESAAQAGFQSFVLSDATKSVAEPSAVTMKERLVQAGVKEITTNSLKEQRIIYKTMITDKKDADANHVSLEETQTSHIQASESAEVVNYTECCEQEDKCCNVIKINYAVNIMAVFGFIFTLLKFVDNILEYVRDEDKLGYGANFTKIDFIIQTCINKSLKTIGYALALKVVCKPQELQARAMAVHGFTLIFITAFVTIIWTIMSIIILKDYSEMRNKKFLTLHLRVSSIFIFAYAYIIVKRYYNLLKRSEVTTKPKDVELAQS